MTITFYTLPFGPTSRAVWMTLEALGLEYDEKITNIMAGEHKTEEYKKINYIQQVPAIKDGDFCLGESRAIATYLCNEYAAHKGKQDLYPKDAKIRATVDMNLYMDDTFYQRINSYLNLAGVIRRGQKPNMENFEDVKAVLASYEDILTKRQCVAEDHITIADFFGYVTTGLLYVNDFDYSPYPKVVAWRQKMAELSYHAKTCTGPLEQMRAAYQSKLNE